MASSDSESDDSSVYSDLEREAAEEKSDEESEEKSDDESEGSAEEAFDADKEFERNDSSDEEDLRNTIGNIPISWYDDKKHIGYDWSGKPIKKPTDSSASKSEIERFLQRMEDPNFYRLVRDRQTGAEVALTDDQVQTISNITRGRYPDIGYNPYQPFVDWFSSEVAKHPISNRPEPKSAFIPSKWEKQMVGKFLHALKMGWIKPTKPKTEEEEEEQQKFFDLWLSETDSDQLSHSQLARLKMQLPAPKMKLPGHEESYNPPPEYLFTEEEKAEWETQEPYERKIDFIPQKYSSMRAIPAYRKFVNDRFNRCLDLYLAPRQRRMKLNVNPDDLLPKLPKPEDLEPFPIMEALVYYGHTDVVRCIAVESSGQYFASGSNDGTIRIWEISTGRCYKTIQFGDKIVYSLAWSPNSKRCLLLAAVGSNVYIINTEVGDKLVINDTDNMIDGIRKMPKLDASGSKSAVEWKWCEDELQKQGCRIVIENDKDVKCVTWHANGDYFGSISPESGVVVVHQLSKWRSQFPFTKKGGTAMQRMLFHPHRPLLYLATERHVKIYDLSKRQLLRKLQCNCRFISSLALHPKGDHLLVGSYDCRALWFDLDLSLKPYQTLRYHKRAIRAVAYHPHYPLFATCSDDGTTIICHGQVHNDFENPVIVPVKVLRGHQVIDGLGVTECIFHPRQPWILTAGADKTIRLYT